MSGVASGRCGVPWSDSIRVICLHQLRGVALSRRRGVSSSDEAVTAATARLRAAARGTEDMHVDAVEANKTFLIYFLFYSPGMHADAVAAARTGQLTAMVTAQGLSVGSGSVGRREDSLACYCLACCRGQAALLQPRLDSLAYKPTDPSRLARPNRYTASPLSATPLSASARQPQPRVAPVRMERACVRPRPSRGSTGAAHQH